MRVATTVAAILLLAVLAFNPIAALVMRVVSALCY